MSNKTKLTGKPLTPVFRHVLNNDGMFRPTFLERLKILIGYNVEFKYEALLAHSPGAIEPKLSARVTSKL